MINMSPYLLGLLGPLALFYGYPLYIFRFLLKAYFPGLPFPALIGLAGLGLTCLYAVPFYVLRRWKGEKLKSTVLPGLFVLFAAAHIVVTMMFYGVYSVVLSNAMIFQGLNSSVCRLMILFPIWSLVSLGLAWLALSENPWVRSWPGRILLFAIFWILSGLTSFALTVPPASI